MALKHYQIRVTRNGASHKLHTSVILVSQLRGEGENHTEKSFTPLANYEACKENPNFGCCCCVHEILSGHCSMHNAIDRIGCVAENIIITIFSWAVPYSLQCEAKRTAT